MTPANERAELLDLLWAMCDQSISLAQGERLEQMVRGSAEARRIYALYMGMVQTLAWERLPQRERETHRPITPDVLDGNLAENKAPARLLPFPIRFVSSPLRVACILVGALGGSALGFWLFVLQPSRTAPNLPVVKTFATLSGADACRWGSDAFSGDVGSRLPKGQVILREGVAEITFDTGAKLVLEGPSTFEIAGDGRAILGVGKLIAHVPHQAKGFTVQTPSGNVVDLGTEFGIVTDATGQTDVFAFDGTVEVMPPETTAKGRTKQQLVAGQALRLTPTSATPLGIDSTLFVRMLPTPPAAWLRVSQMRDLVAKHPKLMHHYTFEGDKSLGEHLLDRKGSVPLREVAFGAGSTGEIGYPVGLDASTTAFTPQRTGPTSGGAALRTETRITLPPRLTLECLVRPLNACGEGCALYTRAGHSHRGHLLSKSGYGPFFSTMIGSDYREGRPSPRFIPGHWYYIASTFERAGEDTIVNMYVANVTAGQSTLSHVGNRGQKAVGNYGTSAHLRIGHGLMPNNVPCFPFAGTLDEIALYGDVLTPGELQERLRILVEEPPARRDQKEFVMPPDD